jgi:hypothetical protein
MAVSAVLHRSLLSKEAGMKTPRLPSRIVLVVLLAAALLWSATLLATAAPAGPDPSSDTTPPTAKLVKPADLHWKGASFVTGQDFLLVGEAEDQRGVKSVWFELCPEGTPACLEDWDSAPGDGSWRAIGDVPADETPGIPGQYQAEWGSTEAPDGFYFMRICAEDIAGNSNCVDSRVDLPLIGEDEYLNPYLDAHWVYVSNQIECPLQVGWNLISTPLLPYDTDIQNVMSHLVDHGTVEAAWSMFNKDDARVWKVWTPAAGPVDTLTTIVDG